MDVSAGLRLHTPNNFAGSLHARSFDHDSLDDGIPPQSVFQPQQCMIMRHKSYMQKGATACTKKLATSYESWPQSAIVIDSRVLPAPPRASARQ